MNQNNNNSVENKNPGKRKSGNKKQYVFATLGASNFAKGEREPNDFYATDPKAIDYLMQRESFQKNILEPCCGQGHLSKAIEKYGHQVNSFDLIDRGYGGVQDFLTYDTLDTDFDIITNPPYSKIDRFIVKGLSLLKEKRQKMAMFIRLLFLEGQKRLELLSKYPPAIVYVSSKRIMCAKNGDFDKYASSATCYAWFVWRYGFCGDPVIKWF